MPLHPVQVDVHFMLPCSTYSTAIANNSFVPSLADLPACTCNSCVAFPSLAHSPACTSNFFFEFSRRTRRSFSGNIPGFRSQNALPGFLAQYPQQISANNLSAGAASLAAGAAAWRAGVEAVLIGRASSAAASSGVAFLESNSLDNLVLITGGSPI